MERRRIAHGFAVAICALLPLSAQAQSPSPFAPVINRLRHVVDLPGSVLPRLAQAQRTGALASGQTLTVDLSLKLRDEAALQGLLRSMYTPGSPLFHHFLTFSQFEARFAPDGMERQAAMKWLQSTGLHVDAISRNGLQVTATGSVAQVQKTFGTSLYTFRQGGRSFFANARPVQVPATLASTIVAVSGLNNAVQAHSHRTRLLSMREHTTKRHIKLHSPSRDNIPGLDPTTVASLYDIKPFYDNSITGAGQTIAMVEFTNVSDQNLSTFDTQFGIAAPNLQRIPVTYASKAGGSSINSNEQAEAEMDIEIAHAIAPGARILVYEGPNTKLGSNLAVYNQIVSDNTATVISSSYGWPESHSDPDLFKAFDQVFQQAAAQGQSILAASGDNGAYDAAANKDDPDAGKLMVDYPASDPWVTGVGGTALFPNNDNTVTEKPWADTTQNPNTGGGGGLSAYWKRPWYQTGAGIDTRYSNGYRQVPDVSALADPYNPGYAIYTSSDGQTGWQASGGTSAAAPLWAAYTALLNGTLNTPMGFLNPTLYALGQKAGSFQNAPFNDVTQGDNLYYRAGPGYDVASGWGSMDGAALHDDIVTMGGPVHAAPQPSVQIKRAYITVKVNGQYQVVRGFHLGQYAWFQFSYGTLNAGGIPTSATIIFYKNGKAQSQSPLQMYAKKYSDGTPGFYVKELFKNPASVGAQWRAVVTATIGSVTDQKTIIFSVLR